MTTEVMGFGDSTVTLVLALFGLGMTGGALAAGPLTDRALRPTLYGSLAALVLALVAFRFTVHVPWLALVTVVVLGVVGFMTTTPLQMLVMNKAADAPTPPPPPTTRPSTSPTRAAPGGRRGRRRRLGWTSPTLVGAGLTVVGLAVAAVAGLLDCRTPEGASRVVAGSPPRPPKRKGRAGVSRPGSPASGS